MLPLQEMDARMPRPVTLTFDLSIARVCLHSGKVLGIV